MVTKSLKDGEVTQTIYNLIKEGKYDETIELLNTVLQSFDKSKPALSLLGFCYYQQQDFVNASDCYEQLTLIEPDNEEYRLYYAQSLYKASLYEESMQASVRVEASSLQLKVTKLQAAIKYSQEDLVATKKLMDECPQGDADTLNNMGCISFKEKKYEEAIKFFKQTEKIIGEKPFLLYNIALCHYMTKEFKTALACLSKIISKVLWLAERLHKPEISIREFIMVYILWKWTMLFYVNVHRAIL